MNKWTFGAINCCQGTTRAPKIVFHKQKHDIDINLFQCSQLGQLPQPRLASLFWLEHCFANLTACFTCSKRFTAQTEPRHKLFDNIDLGRPTGSCPCFSKSGILRVTYINSGILRLFEIRLDSPDPSPPTTPENKSTKIPPPPFEIATDTHDITSFTLQKNNESYQMSTLKKS